MPRSIFPSGAVLLSVAALGAAGTLLASAANAAVTPPLFNVPGIPQAGFPDFTNSSNASLVFLKVPFGGDYLLAASGGAGAFNLASTRSYSVNDELFAMYAEFNSKGQFISGGETIFGNIPGLTGNRFQNLYSVAFDKYAVATVGLGFESVLSTASGFASKYQNTDESLYLYSRALGSLDSALASGKNLPSFFSASVSEFTTVPLPAAGWLLGTGLLGLIAIGRARRLGPEGLNASWASSQASLASAGKKPQVEVLKAKPHQGEAVKAWDRKKTSEFGWFGAYSCRLLG
jgi:hypothetical protein